MKQTNFCVGKFLCASRQTTTPRKDICIEYCFDITEDLPSARKCRGSLWIGFARLSDGDVAVQMLLDEHTMSCYRTLRELRDLQTSSSHEDNVPDTMLTYQLNFFGLTPHRFVELVNQAFAQFK